MNWTQVASVSVQIVIYGVLIVLLALYVVRRLQREHWLGAFLRDLTPDEIEVIYDKAANRAIRWANVVYGGLDDIGEDRINEIIDYAVVYLAGMNIQTPMVELIRKMIHELLTESANNA